MLNKYFPLLDISLHDSSRAILVDEKVIEDDDTTIIRCGSEIILGSDTEGER